MLKRVISISNTHKARVNIPFKQETNLKGNSVINWNTHVEDEVEFCESEGNY